MAPNDIVVLLGACRLKFASTERQCNETNSNNGNFKIKIKAKHWTLRIAIDIEEWCNDDDCS